MYLFVTCFGGLRAANFFFLRPIFIYMRPNSVKYLHADKALIIYLRRIVHKGNTISSRRHFQKEKEKLLCCFFLHKHTKKRENLEKHLKFKSYTSNLEKNPWNVWNLFSFYAYQLWGLSKNRF